MRAVGLIDKNLFQTPRLCCSLLNEGQDFQQTMVGLSVLFLGDLDKTQKKNIVNPLLRRLQE